jgi:hypothetical protein
MDDLLSQLAREAVTEAANNALADHANRRGPGDPAPTSVHNGRLVLALGAITTVALCLGFAWLIIDPNALEHDGRGVWLALCGAFALLSALGLWASIRHRIDWDGDRVRFRGFLSERFLPWSDIVGAAKKSYPPRIRIELRDGGAFAIFETMNNSRYFMRLIESRLAPQTPDGGKRRRRRQHRKSS